MSSNSNFGKLPTKPSSVQSAGKTLALPPPALLFLAVAARNSAPISAAVTEEPTRFIANAAYTLPISSSLSAPSAENLRPTCRDLVFTRKWLGQWFSISSAALTGNAYIPTLCTHPEPHSSTAISQCEVYKAYRVTELSWFAIKDFSGM
nr:hypothetical protein Iba_chr11bCG7650 [Ipomoea batatas]